MDREQPLLASIT